MNIFGKPIRREIVQVKAIISRQTDRGSLAETRAKGAPRGKGGPARTGFAIVTNEIGVSIIHGLGIRGIYVINVAKVVGSLFVQPIRCSGSSCLNGTESR